MTNQTSNIYAASIGFKGIWYGTSTTFLNTEQSTGYKVKTTLSLPGALKTFFVAILFILPFSLFAATKTWTGAIDNDFSNTLNWSGGFPASGDDVIIGTSPNYPDITSGTFVIKSLKINAGASFSFSGTSFTIKGGALAIYGTYNQSAGNVLTDNNITVYTGGVLNMSGGLLHLDDVLATNPTKNLLIQSGANVYQTGGTIEVYVYSTSPGTFTQNGPGAVFKLFRDWLPGNNCVFNSISGTLELSTSGTSSNYGTGTLQFNNIIVNSGINPKFDRSTSIIPISGNFTNYNTSYNCGNKATFLFNGTGTQTVYSASSGTNATFGFLEINKPSGSVVLTSNAYVLSNTTITNGTYDLSTFISNRRASGGVFTIGANGTLRLAATTGGQTGSNFPLNFTTISALPSTSTVEYYGGNQTVYSIAYGNLILSGTSGTVVKTMPSTAFSVQGNFTSILGTASSVSYTAASIWTVSGNMSVGTGTTFSAASFSHVLSGNLVNEGTITGSTSTITMNGTNKSFSGGGTNNLNNLTLTAAGITATATSITVAGNLATTGSGAFTQTTGLLTMSGTTKTISGSNIAFNNLTIGGTITSTSALVINGNVDVNASRSLVMSSGSITMTGTGKTISNSATLTLANLTITGSVTTASGFTISSLLDVTDGSFTATAGTITFTGTSLLSGTANLFNVTLNGTSLQLDTDAILGIAGTYTISAGTLNVTTSAPNTVHYNGTGAINIPSGTYHHLELSGSVKTAIGAITVNGNFIVNAAASFSASTFTHVIRGNLLNSGTFTAGTSTIQFTGTSDAVIRGTTTFNIATINKSSASVKVTLQSNISVGTLNMTLGTLFTENYTLTITTTRTGAGIILGNIQRTHIFLPAVSYEFEGQANTINFTSVSGVTSVLVKVTVGSVKDFPNGGAINRLYEVAVTGGSYTATLRLHYEDVELNGNNEASMKMYEYTTIWTNPLKTGNNTTTNFVELSGITNLNRRWTCSDDVEHVARWNGSVSSNWATAANWTVISGSPATPPSAIDIVQIGYATYVNAPIISTTVSVKSLTFGSTFASTLALTTGGSLAVSGNISGSWSANQVHTINANNQNITVNGDVILSDGTAGRAINVNIGTGTVAVLGSVTQSGGANIVFTGGGNLNIGSSYIYTSGTFTGGTGTVLYNGTGTQNLAAIGYNNLTINKAAGIANINNATTIAGNLAVTAGQLVLNASPTVSGNLTIASGATLTSGAVTTYVGGNWSNSGTFTASNGTVTLTGSGTSTVSASTFNNLAINKPGGTASLSANINVIGNLTLSAGSFNIGTFTANRTVAGGTLTISGGATLLLAGANNFPSNFTTNTINSTSTVNYNGTIAQTIATKTYGHLTISNGGANAKTPAASTIINGDLTISSGSTLAGSSFTLTVLGNWSNSGTFTAATSTINLNGTAKTLTGTTVFNHLTVNGSYTVTGTNFTTNGLFWITNGASINTGAGTITVSQHFTNNGSFVSTGTVTYTGTQAQTIQNNNSVVATWNIVNFNGTVAPTLTSNFSPVIATLNVNNTAGITTAIGWTITTACTVASGSAFNGGVANHVFGGSFTNNGTVTSSGELFFNPTTAQTIQLKGTTFTSTGTVKFGGTAAMTVSGTPNTITNVIIDNTVGVTTSVAWSIAGNFTINAGKVFNAGSFSYTVAGDFRADGTMNPGTSTFTLTSGSGTLSGSDNASFYDLIITGTISVVGDYNVLRNFTNNGSYDGAGGALVMTGNLASTITGSAATFGLAQLTTLKTGAGSATLAKNINAVTDLHILSGTFNASTFTITKDVAGGDIWIADDATFKIGGTNTLPNFTSYNLEPNSTVEYTGTTQSVSAAATYGNLMISTSGNKTAAAALTLAGNFSLATGTFIGGSFTHNIGGNWTMSSGAFTNTGTKITLNGSVDQTISSTGAFNNLEINKASGNAVLATDVTVNGILNFVAGKINTNAFKVIIPSTGSVTGAAQGTGWVNGNLQKNVATGSNVSRTFEVGGSTYYSPVTSLFASVTVQGNLVVKSTATDHPQIATSGFNPSLTVNRFYSTTNSGIVFTTATLTFNWATQDMDAGTNPLLFNVAHYNGAIWTYPSSANPSSTSIQAIAITLFGDFAIGYSCIAGTWTGVLSTDWANIANWECGILPTSLINVTIPSGRTFYPVLTADIIGIVNNLTIHSGGTVTLSDGSIEIHGSIVNNGTFNAAGGKVSMKGNSAQTIPANAFASNNVKELVINNLAGVTVAGPINIIDYLTIKGGFINTGGFITLKSSVTNTAQIPPITSVAATPINGNITVERYVPGRRKYRLITSSVNTSAQNTLSPGQEAQSIWGNWQMSGSTAAQNVGTSITGGSAADGFDQITPSASLYTYNEVTRKFVAHSSANGKNTKLTPLKAGAGYYMFVYGDRQNSASATSPRPTVLSATGTVNTGNQIFNSSSAIPLTPVPDRFTLIGNPFPAMVDWKSVQKSDVSQTIWGWDANLASTGGYVTVTATGGGAIVSPMSELVKISRYVQPGQAFFVKTTGVSPQIVMREADKASNKTNINAYVFRTDSTQGQPLLAVNLLYTSAGNTILADGIVAGFDNSFSNAVTGEDGTKMAGNAESIAWLNGNDLLAIDARKIPVNDTLHVNSLRLTRSSYTLQIFANDMHQLGVQLYLKDKFLQTETQLSLVDTNKVVFAITADTASQSASRFSFIFRSNTLTLPVTFSSIKAVKREKDIQVDWMVATESGIKNYEVEKSTDGNRFTKVGDVFNVSNNNNTANYKWIDVNPVPGNNYYRIRAVEMSGTVNYSNVVSVNMAGKNPEIRIAPNPVKGRMMNLYLQDLTKGNYTVKIFNAQGVQVFNSAIVNDEGSKLQKMLLPVGLAGGFYQVQVAGEGVKLGQTILVE